MRALLWIALVGLLPCSPALHAETARYAVSLSYDDSLASQLDNAVPVLNRLGLHASFYVFPNSDAFGPRLEEWRALAKQGHELGNHSLYHICDSRNPDRDWVQPYADLSKRTVAGVRQELMLANRLLQALDGARERTYTIPCGDLETADGNYLPAITDLFVAIKGQGTADGSEVLYTPTELDGADLIELVKNVDPAVKVISLLFHGIGGDHLAVSTAAHTELLEYLAAHPDLYRVDTYINIMRARDAHTGD